MYKPARLFLTAAIAAQLCLPIAAIAAVEPLPPTPIPVEETPSIAPPAPTAPVAPAPEETTELLAPKAPGAAGVPSPRAVVGPAPAAPAPLAPGEAPMGGPAAAGPPTVAPGDVAKIKMNVPAAAGITPVDSFTGVASGALIVVICLGTGIATAYGISMITGKRISFNGK